MDKLEDFYTNHFKTNDSLKWHELDNDYKKRLKNSSAYWSYNKNKAIESFKKDFLKTWLGRLMLKTINYISVILKS